MTCAATRTTSVSAAVQGGSPSAPSVTRYAAADERTSRPRFLRSRRAGDANHRSAALRSARPTATATVGAMSCTSSTRKRLASNATALNGSNSSTGVSKARPAALQEPLLLRRAAADDDAVDAIRGGGGFEEIESLLISSMTFSLTARSTGRASSKVTPSTAGRASVDRLFERQVELFLKRFGIGVAPIEMSRVNTDWSPWRMLMLVALAPA